jgi:hypothetical protein
LHYRGLLVIRRPGIGDDIGLRWLYHAQRQPQAETDGADFAVQLAREDSRRGGAREPARPERAISATTISMPRALLKTIR